MTQLLSWGVLFYGFAVVASDVTADTGWSETVVSGAFSLGLLVSGLAAPAVAAALARHDARLVLTAGSLLGVSGLLLFASANHPGVLYLSWMVIGVAMAATLYEPAMAVVVALDRSRRHRTLATLTVAGGLASTVFAPLGGMLVDHLGWRGALVVLALVGGVGSAFLHALVVPPAPTVAAPPEPASPQMLARRPVRRLRTALLFEQAAMLATTTHLIGLLVAEGATLGFAGAALGVMGLGKVAGRVLLLGPVRGRSLTGLAVTCNLVQFAGLAVPLVTIQHGALLASTAVVGAASGATTMLRPLLIVDLVGPRTLRRGERASAAGHHRHLRRRSVPPRGRCRRCRPARLVDRRNHGLRRRRDPLLASGPPAARDAARPGRERRRVGDVTDI